MVRLVDTPPVLERPVTRSTRRRRLRQVVEVIGYGLLAAGVYFALKLAFTFSRLDYL